MVAVDEAPGDVALERALDDLHLVAGHLEVVELGEDEGRERGRVLLRRRPVPDRHGHRPALDGRALGAKYEHAKHGMRLEAWWGHVVERQATDWVECVLLLGADQQVCTAKCLPAMKAAGIVVMRRAT